MEFKELLTKRYAAKAFQDKVVPEETMGELLEMIRLAPSGLNIQPWRIKVVSDSGVKHQLLSAAPDEPQIGACSHLLVFCADTDWAGQTQKLGRTMKEKTVPDKVWGIVMGIAAEMATEPEDELQVLDRGQCLYGCHVRTAGRSGPGPRHLPDDPLPAG